MTSRSDPRRRRVLAVSGELFTQLTTTTVAGLDTVLFAARSQRPTLQDADWLNCCRSEYLRDLIGYFLDEDPSSITAAAAYKAGAGKAQFIVNRRMTALNGALLYALDDDSLVGLLKEGFALAQNVPSYRRNKKRQDVGLPDAPDLADLIKPRALSPPPPPVTVAERAAVPPVRLPLVAPALGAPPVVPNVVPKDLPLVLSDGTDISKMTKGLTPEQKASFAEALKSANF